MAKMLGRGTQSDAYTEKVDRWVKSLAVKPTPDVLSRANAALARILGPESELRELWEESDDFDKWHSSVTGLQAAIGS